MIDPSAINPVTLPSVSLADRRNLPSMPCIYFAIDGAGAVQYIGRSKNPARRWIAHHRYPDLCSMSGVRIAYMHLDEDLLPTVEDALIAWFNPPLNRPAGRPAETRVPFLSRVDVATPAKIQQIAKVLGYIYAGEGSQGKLLDAIARGELVLIKFPKNGNQ